MFLYFLYFFIYLFICSIRIYIRTTFTYNKSEIKTVAQVQKKFRPFTGSQMWLINNSECRNLETLVIVVKKLVELIQIMDE